MATSTLKTRIKHKIDTASNWASSNLVPLEGELVIYKGDKPQIKVGDGSTAVGSLPFIKAGSDTTITQALTSGTEIGSISIDGVATKLYAPSTIAWGNITGKPSTFTPSEHSHDYLPAFITSLTEIAKAPGAATSGWYHVSYGDDTIGPTTNHGSYIIENDVGTPYQIFFPDNSLYMYKRYSVSGSWNSWSKMSAGYADSAATASTATYAKFLESDDTGACFRSTKNSTALLIGRCDNVTNWSTERDGTNQQMAEHYYNSDGSYLVGRIGLNSGNYSNYALPLSGGTLTGALNLANGTWNKVGDDCYFGDHNRAGSFGIKGANGSTTLSFVSQDGSTSASMVFDGTAIWHTNHSVFEAGLTVGSQGSNNYAELIVARKHKDNSNYGRLISCLESDLSSSSIIYQINGATHYSSLLFGNGYLFTSNQIRTNRTGGSWITARNNAAFCLNTSTTASSWCPIWSIKTQQGDISAGVIHPNDVFHIIYNTDTNYNNNNNSSHIDLLNLTLDGTLRSSKIYGAVWNDYAEFRQTVPHAKPGQIVTENGDGTQRITTERLQRGCNVVSDTFGFAIGETDECKTPIACAGRALVYTYENRYDFQPGEAVCSGPNGTVSRMTREEMINNPDCIVGFVSEIPEYEVWGTGNIEVDGRIWIKVK